MGAEPPAPNGQASASGESSQIVDPIKKAKKIAYNPVVSQSQVQDEKTALKAAKKEKAAAKAKAREEAEKKQNAGGGPAKGKKAVVEEAKAKEAADVEVLIQKAQATPRGQKKAYSTIEDMPKAYHPRFVEAATYSWWEESGFFKPSMESTADNFVIVLPPPNVTGSLHLGHALTDAIQDAVTRWHRMSGRNALWVPGLDHASIATQSIVEKTLLKRGLKREELGREKFLEEVHKWVDEYGGKICKQMRRLGTSCDWSRQAYTMNEQLSAAVQEAFLRMHAEGLIYRDVRLVNWDCQLRTAVSDSEVDYADVVPYSKIKVPGYSQPVEFGVLTSFAYRLEQPIDNGAGGTTDEIVVATTRPETMIGDTGIAVHPDDPRYKQAVGKYAVHPLNQRKIPIVADSVLVDMEFGTGAVKITPAHDPNDFETGKRHSLEFINILTDDGRINHQGQRFEGLPRFQARVEVVDWLKEESLFRGTAGNEMRLGTCSRSGDVIEPVIKPQWWVDCKEMGEAAAAAVHNGSLTVLPSPKSLLDWTSRLRDWCISRQLWWGHRIPAFYYTLEGEGPAPPGSPSERTDHWVAAADARTAAERIKERHPGAKIASIEQDVDVLDTWFSSGLFPFSVMGWPEQTEDLQKFYPTSLLETGNDIIFFWVLRMVMMGMKLTGKLPFHTVYLHSMVRDAHGRKMSKSLGNVIDPLEVIEGVTLEQLHAKLREGNLAESEIEKATQGQKADYPDGIEECGTDALRLTLLQYLSQGKDLNLDIKRVVANRHWCNKLWNAIRFALLNLGSGFQPSPGFPSQQVQHLPLACRWILSRLAATVKATGDGFAGYEFGDAVQGLYAWWQYDLCDNFIELVKPAVQLDEAEASSAARKQAFRDTLWLCLDIGLRLVHPVMPFVTEELWQRLPKGSGPQPASIMLAPFPQPQEAWLSSAADEAMDFMKKVVAATRGLRSEYNLVRERPRLLLRCSEQQRASWLREHGDTTIAVLATAESTEVISPQDAGGRKNCATAVVDDTTAVMMELSGGLLEKELNRLHEREASLSTQRAALEKRMSAVGYDKAGDQVKAADEEKASRLDGELQTVQAALQNLST